MKERKILGLILSNVHDELLSDMTEKRTLGSVPFGGRYRLIDFTLSAMANAGIVDVGVVPRSNYQSLIDHLGSGREWDLSRKLGGLCILPPFGRGGSGIYRGRMEALAGVKDYIRRSGAETVVLTDCDMVTNLDLAPAIEAHSASGADITLLYKRDTLTADSSHDYQSLFFDGAGRLTDMLLVPRTTGEQNLFMDTAIIRKPLLDDLIEDSIRHNEQSFARSVLMAKKDVLNIRGFRCTGYSTRVTSMRHYFRASMDLLSPEVRDSLFPKERPIYTHVRDEVSAKYGLDAEVSNCLVTDGCIIDGRVENSIIFRGVRVAKGAVVKNCVLMHNTVVSAGARLEYIITDKNVTVSENTALSGAETYPVYIAKGSVV